MAGGAAGLVLQGMKWERRLTVAIGAEAGISDKGATAGVCTSSCGIVEQQKVLSRPLMPWSALHLSRIPVAVLGCHTKEQGLDSRTMSLRAESRPLQQGRAQLLQGRAPTSGVWGSLA